MSQPLYKVYNGPMVTTAAPVKVTTGTSIKTMLQLLHPTNQLKVVEWGISFDGMAAATPIECELLSTGTVAATVTAYVANDVEEFSNPTGNAPGLTLSTSGSGYTSSAEGSITATRNGDLQLIAPTNQFVKQFPLDQEFVVKAADVLRIRVTAGTAVNCYCYVVFGVG
jgi:hypothetical protein